MNKTTLIRSNTTQVNLLYLPSFGFGVDMSEDGLSTGRNM
jgi:hypothetical protein